MGLLAEVQYIDRRVKAVLRAVDVDELSKDELSYVKQLKQLCNEARLDVRDYESAETKVDEQKAAVTARKNLMKIEKCILQLSGVFGAADTAEFGALIDTIRVNLT